MPERQRGLFDDSTSEELTWREQYNATISSKRWRLLRKRRLEKSNHSCERCGWKKQTWDKSRTLDLHHRTYERLGAERNEDLDLLCSVCHRKADRERAEEGRRRSAMALREAQFSGWAMKVYGEDYPLYDDEIMRDRFSDWMERKEVENW